MRDCQWRLGLWQELEGTLRSPAPPHSSDAAMIRAYAQARCQRAEMCIVASLPTRELCVTVTELPGASL